MSEVDHSPSVAEWLDHLCKSLTEKGLSTPHGEPMPAFPPEALQVGTTGLGGAAALMPAAGFYADIVDTGQRLGRPLTRDSRIVDFGSGWGRITRFFLRDTVRRNITGLDVDPGFVDISNQLFGSDSFQVCQPLPPTTLDGGSIDLVTAFSVFSHLSEDACRQWIAEFARVLKPGGLLVFTTRNEWFLDLCVQLAQMSDLSDHQKALTRLFSDWDDAKWRFRAGEFVHSPTGGGGVRDASYYGESFIPRSYIEREYGTHFELVFASDSPQPGAAREQLAARPVDYDQACFILRRRG